MNKLKEILKPKPKTEDQLKSDRDYEEYGHSFFSPASFFDDVMTICSSDCGCPRKRFNPTMKDKR